MISETPQSFSKLHYRLADLFPHFSIPIFQMLQFPALSTNLHTVHTTQFAYFHYCALHCCMLQYFYFLVFIFTARCTLVQSAALQFTAKRGIAIACLSICLSVRPSICNVGGSGPHWLEILETNCTGN